MATTSPSCNWAVKSVGDLISDLGEAGEIEEKMDLAGLPGGQLTALFVAWVLEGRLDASHAGGLAEGLLLGWLLRERWSFANAEMT